MYVGEHILPVLESKEYQTVKRVIEILTLKYGRTRVEKIEDFMDNWSKFKDDHYEYDSKLLLGMKELNQRRKELKMREDVWVAQSGCSTSSRRGRDLISLYINLFEM